MRLDEVARRTGGWVAPEHAGVEISSVASLADANPGDISFYGNPRYLTALRKSRATVVLVPHGFSEDILPIRIWVDNPAVAFSELLKAFAPEPIRYERGVHPTAVIGSGVVLGEDVCIQPYAVLEAGVKIGAGSIIGAHSLVGEKTVIGDRCHIYPHVTIRERTKIGNNVILHPGVVLGSDGFGYEFKNGRQEKIPQTGIVQIDDDVEIGANSTVDRARFGRTWLQRGVKLDNLVQIAHNVTIGEHSIICAHVGISGSVRVGSYVTLAGKVGVNGHIEIGDGAIVTAMAGVTKSVAPKEILVGLPAKPMKEYKLNYVQLHGIHKLYDRVKKLEEAARLRS